MDTYADYNLLNDDEVLLRLAEEIENLRIMNRLKESDLERATGISRKTFYNFRQGKTSLSLKNFIRILRALNELERLQSLFKSESYSPRMSGKKVLPKQVRDRQKEPSEFQWGDEI